MTRILDSYASQALPMGLKAMNQTMVDYSKLFGRLQELTGKALTWDEKLERKYLTQTLQPYVGALSTLPARALGYGELPSLVGYREAQTQMALADPEYKKALADYYTVLKQNVLSELDPNSPINKAMSRLFEAYEKYLGSLIGTSKNTMPIGAQQEVKKIENERKNEEEEEKTPLFFPH